MERIERPLDSRQCVTSRGLERRAPLSGAAGGSGLTSGGASRCYGQYADKRSPESRGLHIRKSLVTAAIAASVILSETVIAAVPAQAESYNLISTKNKVTGPCNGQRYDVQRGNGFMSGSIGGQRLSGTYGNGLSSGSLGGNRFSCTYGSGSSNCR
jgi:hypothetical protein